MFVLMFGATCYCQFNQQERCTTMPFADASAPLIAVIFITLMLVVISIIVTVSRAISRRRQYVSDPARQVRIFLGSFIVAIILIVLGLFVVSPDFRNVVISIIVVIVLLCMFIMWIGS